MPPERSDTSALATRCADHCPDCIDLALGGPYRPDELPATPRSGYTQCLSNCQCSLEIEYEQPSVIDLDIRPASARDANKLGLIWLAWYLARRRKSKKRRDSDFPEYNSGELLDWNVLSKASEYLLEIRHAEQSDDVVEKAVRQYSALEKFAATCAYLPKWLDPLSKDFTYWHAIGARVKAYHVQQLRKTRGRVMAKAQEAKRFGSLTEPEKVFETSLCSAPHFHAIEILEESEQDKNPHRLLQIRGVASRGGVVNKNNRLYPVETLAKAVHEAQKAIAEGKLLGELDHPETPRSGRLKHAAIKFTKLWMDGDLMWFEADVLPTKSGRDLYGLLISGVGIGMSH